jgi:hypothetical protein
VLFAAVAIYSAFERTRFAPGFGLLAVGYAVPFTRRQFRATGSDFARLASVRFLLQVLGSIYLLAAMVGPPSQGAFWMIFAVALAIFLPVWVWSARLLAAGGREANEALRSTEEK